MKERNKYTLSILFAMLVFCGPTLAGGNATSEEMNKQRDAIQELMDKGIYADDPRFGPSMEKATGTKATFAPGYDWYGKIVPGVAPRYGPTAKGDVPTGYGTSQGSGAFGDSTASVQAQHNQNLIDMKSDMAAMEVDRRLIQKAIAEGKNPNDPQFRDDFLKAEKVGRGLEQTAIQKNVEIVPIKTSPVIKSDGYKTRKPLVSMEKKGDT